MLKLGFSSISSMKWVSRVYHCCVYSFSMCNNWWRWFGLKFFYHKISGSPLLGLPLVCLFFYSWHWWLWSLGIFWLNASLGCLWSHGDKLFSWLCFLFLTPRYLVFGVQLKLFCFCHWCSLCVCMCLITVVCACVLTPADGYWNSFLILLFTIVGILSRTLF